MAADTQQIGTVGGEEPVYCGCGCGEEVRNREGTSHSLGGDKYTRYLAKHDYKWNEEYPAEPEPAPTFRKIVLPKAQAVTVQKNVDKKGDS